MLSTEDKSSRCRDGLVPDGARNSRSFGLVAHGAIRNFEKIVTIVCLLHALGSCSDCIMGKDSGMALHIAGVDVRFPFAPYPSQVQMMGTVCS